MPDRSSAARSEEPTPLRLAEARRQGEVAVSPDLTGAAVVFAVLVVMAIGAKAGLGQLVVYLRASLLQAAQGTTRPAVALAAGGKQGLALLALPLGLACAITVAVGLVQTGGLFAPKAARFGLRRVVPSLRRIIDAGALVGLAKGLGGALVLLGVAYATLAPLVRPVASLTGASAGQVLAAAGTMGARLGWRMTVALLALGALDLLWRRARHGQSLRMTRDEVERERKQHEGDPQRKVERRRLHRAALEEGGSDTLGQADFVVTGFRVAIALAYRGGPAAPVVVARGERLVAARLGEAARSRRLPIFADVALAQALLGVAVGEEIPVATHGPVAGIVKVVLEQRGEAR
jgi:flagellar biosynthetic protein FlhB